MSSFFFFYLFLVGKRVLTAEGKGTAKDHYKQFIVSVVSDDLWLAKYGCDAELAWREWTPKEMTIKMFKLLEFLIKEWVDGPGDATYRAKTGGNR